MNFHVDIAKEPEWVRFTVTGTRTLEDSLRLLDYILEESKSRGMARALTILDVQGHLPLTDYYEIASYAAKTYPPAFQHAIVDLNAQSLEDNKFGETVAYNRGAGVRIFPDEQSALAWLKEA